VKNKTKIRFKQNLVRARAPLQRLNQWFSKWRTRPLGGDFEDQGDEQNKVGNMGAKQHKGGENAQPLPLIDH